MSSGGSPDKEEAKSRFSKLAERLPDGKTESDTERDGFLSYAKEHHAFAHGVYLGFTTLPWKTPPEPDNEDVNTEPHYYRGAYILGSLLQVLMIAVGGYFGIDSVGIETLIGI